jgi:hypothetical protein
LLLLMQPALDAVAAAVEGRQLLAQAVAAATGPAAPRGHLSFQLAGYSSNASLAAAIKGSIMPTAVAVLQKMFQVRQVHCSAAVGGHVQHDAMRVVRCSLPTLRQQQHAAMVLEFVHGQCLMCRVLLDLQSCCSDAVDVFATVGPFLARLAHRQLLQ